LLGRFDVIHQRLLHLQLGNAPQGTTQDVVVAVIGDDD
jgi:hypothetical protein